MQLRENQFNGGIIIVFDDKKEAIKKAKILGKNNNSVNVVESNNEFFVECPSNDLIRAWEKEIYHS